MGLHSHDPYRNANCPSKLSLGSRVLFARASSLKFSSPRLHFLSFLPSRNSSSADRHIFLQFLIFERSPRPEYICGLARRFTRCSTRRKLGAQRNIRRRQRVASGFGMIGLGAYVALTDTK